MRLLVIGGSVFLGRDFVTQALRRGDRVTTFNRGRSGTDVPGAEVIRGDREDEDDLRRLVEGRRWDAVIDTCGYVPRVVGRSARALSGHADAYLFVSSVHAHADWPERRVDEDSALLPCPPDAGPDAEVPYNALKAGCERAVESEFDGRVLILNPGLIVGPREQVPRLTWWLTRVAAGGPVLAPGDPGRAMQLIDARDIAAFGLARLTDGATGRFLLSGVPGNTTFGALLDECVRVTGSDAVPTWVEDDFLLAQEVTEWTELPMWTADGPASAGVWLPSSEKALRAGLRCRPVTETVRDTWSWILEEKITRDRAVEGGQGIAPEKERRILAAWAATGADPDEHPRTR
ncbi:NAD-dependent epimerase/dehydratase family protein [Actinoallomurus rhizosphaericola]|uniref:NAD-dependent epimerase/dehydratase family protein n=1 Tax=Actinoallomurus rhizosphaericola TaxID=2952536 RepID=UPI002092FE4E|nr:NAD-dependent epimerase/dehydratase family protein [Actinoallomurus rhizosphaericola]MCO5998109.1 NAD-dependent epimerase [Actinoallomurus rhizosphaericola]